MIATLPRKGTPARRPSSARGVKALRMLTAIFGLNTSETGRLFGVSRQAIDEWYENGVPQGRLADVLRAADLANALHKRFLPDRLPQLARAPLPGLGDTSILAAMRRVGTVAIFEMLDRAFGYIPS